MKQRGEGEAEREAPSIASRIAFAGTLGGHRLYDKYPGGRDGKERTLLGDTGRKQREMTLLYKDINISSMSTLMGSVWCWGQ